MLVHYNDLIMCAMMRLKTDAINKNEHLIIEVNKDSVRPNINEIFVTATDIKGSHCIIELADKIIYKKLDGNEIVLKDRAGPCSHIRDKNNMFKCAKCDAILE
jgi:hypothetical protein